MKAGPGDVWQAVNEKDAGRVRQLLESEFDPDEYDMRHGGTPLHQAVWDGETVRFSFEPGVPIVWRLSRCSNVCYEIQCDRG